MNNWIQWEIFWLPFSCHTFDPQLLHLLAFTLTKATCGKSSILTDTSVHRNRRRYVRLDSHLFPCSCWENLLRARRVARWFGPSRPKISWRALSVNSCPLYFFLRKTWFNVNLGYSIITRMIPYRAHFQGSRLGAFRLAVGPRVVIIPTVAV
jgi:hypothetical protein